MSSIRQRNTHKKHKKRGSGKKDDCIAQGKSFCQRFQRFSSAQILFSPCVSSILAHLLTCCQPAINNCGSHFVPPSLAKSSSIAYLVHGRLRIRPVLEIVCIAWSTDGEAGRRAQPPLPRSTFSYFGAAFVPDAMFW